MLFLFYGEETYAPRAAVQALTDKFLAKNPSGAGLTRLDCADGATLADVRVALFAHSLFTERRLVVVENPFALPAADQREVAAQLPHLAAEDVVVFWHRGAVRADSVLLRAASAAAHTAKAYPRLTPAQTTAWVRNAFAQRGVQIDAAAVRELLARLPGADCTQLDLVVAQLTAAADNTTVTAAQIDTLIARRPEADAFAAVEAATAGDRARALTLLQNALDAGEEPIRLLGLYAYGIRTLLAVSDALDRGMAPGAIAAATGQKPFVVSKALGTLRSGTVTTARLLAAHDLLTALDTDIKTGVCDAPLALTRLVARM